MATEADNVNSGALGTLVAVGTVAFFGIALVVTALVRTELAEETEKKDVSADRPYRDLVAEQRAKLDSPAAYLDKTKGVVSLPIERAMELTVQGLKKDPSSATPPAPPSAAPAAAAPGSDGAATPGTTNPAPGEAPSGAVGASKDTSGDKDTSAEKKAPKKQAPTGAAPAPAPAPNGQ